MNVTWANVICGDNKALLRIQKIGTEGLQIRTIDKDPQTSARIVTTDLKLKRI